MSSNLNYVLRHTQRRNRNENQAARSSLSRSKSSLKGISTRPKQVYTGLKHIRNKINNTDSKSIKQYDYSNNINSNMGQPAIFDIVSSHHTNESHKDTLQYFEGAARDQRMATLNLNIEGNTFSFSQLNKCKPPHQKTEGNLESSQRVLAPIASKRSLIR